VKLYHRQNHGFGTKKFAKLQLPFASQHARRAPLQIQIWLGRRQTHFAIATTLVIEELLSTLVRKEKAL
jgi:hypothetical protein